MDMIDHNNVHNPHFEVRLHHGTDDPSEMYNWALFINLLLSNCIKYIDDLFNARHDAKKFNKLFDEIVLDLDVNHTDYNNGVNLKIFNKLFDKFNEFKFCKFSNSFGKLVKKLFDKFKICKFFNLPMFSKDSIEFFCKYNFFTFWFSKISFEIVTFFILLFEKLIIS